MSNVFSGHREPFSASLTATKAPKPKVAAPKPPGVIDKVLSVFAGEKDDLAKQQEELERKKEEREQRLRDYRNLKQQRDKVAFRLERADRQLADAKAKRKELAATLTRDTWGHELDLYRRLPPWAGYQHLAALDAAISDFPNARKHIEAELGEVQERLNALGFSVKDATDVP